MNQAQDKNVISFTQVMTKLPQLMPKLLHLLGGLKQAYLRTARTPTGLGIAFEKAVRRHPEGCALKFEDQQFTYKEINEWANQIAHYYLSLGVKKGDVIAVMMENRPELIVTIIALAKIGVSSALVNTSQTGQVLSHSINLVKPFAVIIGEECQDAIAEIQDDINIQAHHFFWFANLETLKFSGNVPDRFINLAHCIQSFPHFNPATTNSVQGKDGLFYIYTSGTTGLPKAVIFTNSRWMLAYGTYGHVLDLNQTDVMYCTLPLYHATGIVVCWCGVIAGNATLALRRKYSTTSFWKDVQKFDASAIAYVGELCRYLMDVPPSALEKTHRVTKMIGNGMRPNIWNKFKARFGVKEILELYASSEGNVGFSNIFNFDNTVGFSPTPYAVIEFDKERNLPILDEHGRCKKVKKGEIGLLIGKITRRSPFDGYTDAEKNQAVMMHHVFKQGDAYFNTGDLMRDLGYRHTQFVDRLGDTFRWKGENVSTTQVENIMGEYFKIAAAVVYGVEIPHTNGRAGMAAITLIHNMQLDHVDFKNMYDLFQKSLPSYAIPVFLRIQQQVEMTGTFKPQKNKLKAQAFNLSETDEPILILLPGENSYRPLTLEIYNNIQTYQYRF
ncbi:long-chain-acyl-CoA synthetase [Acinetobacter sp. ANC 4558]|uniref:long-chain-acyl-CoA synthetase n=1 Tax=Acinetobacter sp. ANC 4558 TaxID=1977876 RepID=UPI000A34BA98|nr:long-chain-acyl-CoA synthetase [Acinetobacter sp. ANC 4558]OTG85626.1 long-chain-acyl-CoA synthetase [Acinetobacter sp. ANC 4558]